MSELKFEILEKISRFEGIGITYYEFYKLFEENPCEVYNALKELECSSSITGISFDEDHHAFFYEKNKTLLLTNLGEKTIYQDKLAKRKLLLEKIRLNPKFDVNQLNFPEKLILAKLSQEGYIKGIELHAPEGILMNFNTTQDELEIVSELW